MSIANPIAKLEIVCRSLKRSPLQNQIEDDRHNISVKPELETKLFL
ncbi:hypothetical protein [Merismopedia glauca]|nr:hypothetical protein [Merismopedia glauca]